MALFPVGAPTEQHFYIEFTAGVWTDVTAHVELADGSLTSQFGRTSPFSQPGPGSMTVTLMNDALSGNGRYTPQRQVLADGVTPHPYWPNVVPRKRIKRTYTVAGVEYVRFLGYIKGWPPALQQDVRPMVTIQATTRDDQLSRVTMRAPIAQEITTDSPVLWWPLTDPSGSAQAAQAIGGGNPLAVTASPALLAFGDNGPGAGDGTGVKFTPADFHIGQYLSGALPFLDDDELTVEVWVNAGTSLPAWATGAGTEQFLGIGVRGGLPIATLYLANGVPTWRDLSNTITGAASIVDGGWHHIAVTRHTSFSVTTVELYVDGVSAGTSGVSASGTPERIYVGEAKDDTLGDGRFQGNIGQVAVYDYALSAARIAVHATATTGYSGDTTDARAARFLATAGLTAADWTLDAGQTTVGTYPQAGKDVTSACQDMATTEGGVFWFRWDGDARLANRRFRDATTPVLILDASVRALLDPSVYDPDFSEATLVNTSTVSRSAESGVLSTQIYTDPVSAAPPPTGFGPADGDVTTYTLSDLDALNLAQAQVAGNAYPAFRLNQVAVNFHASPVSLYAQLAAVEIGSRIRIINLPRGGAPLGTLDLFVEGLTEYPGPTTYRGVFDTSTAGAPPIKLDDTIYGRLGCDGQTLNTALTNSSTTVVIATAGTLPTFSTTGGDYPLSIQIGEEVITLTAAPGGASSPQTFTGCLRGQQGTFPAAQAAGSVIGLFPATALAL